MKPKMTYIMPSIRDTFFKSAYKSVLNQTVKDIELIVVNNDPERDIKIEDSRVSIINADRLNYAKSINLVTKQAQSDIIAIAHDDDIQFRERTLIALDYHNQGYDIVYGGYIIIDYYGKPMAYKTPIPFDYERQKRQSGMVTYAFISYKKEGIPDLRENYDILSDYLWGLDCYNKGFTLKAVEMPFGYYRMWKSTSQSNKNLRFEEVLRMRKEFNDDTIKRGSWENENIVHNALA